MSKKDNFEKNLEELDQIVSKLESGELTLTEALKSFEDGIKLFNSCHETLKHVEDQVKILVDNMELGDKEEIAFENDGE